MRSTYSLPVLQPSAFTESPGYEPWNRLTDDFECFLDSHFGACSSQAAAVPLSGPSTCAAAPLKREQSWAPSKSSDLPPLPRPMSREERRKVHNRIAQKSWRHKTKVRYFVLSPYLSFARQVGSGKGKSQICSSLICECRLAQKSWRHRSWQQQHS